MDAGYTIRASRAKAALRVRSSATARPDAPRPPGRLRFLPKVLASRPRLALALVVGLLAGAGLWLVPNALLPVTRAILAWDLACALFVGATLWGMRGRDPLAIRARAAVEDEGGAAILLLAVLATVASLGAVAAELQAARGDDGLARSVRVGLAFGTVALSWTFVQLIFALHYAHEYYAPAKAKGRTRGGLTFPGDDAPDYWDFLHFSLIIGVASQTADIAITSKTLRRTGTLHSVIAFGFNTVVLALTINLLAALF